MGTVGKLYLESIAKYIAEKTGIPQQIIFTGDSNIELARDDESDEQFYLILNADVDIKTIDWLDETGITYNGIHHKDNSVIHCFLWDFELCEDDNGIFLYEDGALNGILVIDGEYLSETETSQIKSYNAEELS